MRNAGRNQMELPGAEQLQLPPRMHMRIELGSQRGTLRLRHHRQGRRRCEPLFQPPVKIRTIHEIHLILLPAVNYTPDSGEAQQENDVFL